MSGKPFCQTEHKTLLVHRTTTENAVHENLSLLCVCVCVCVCPWLSLHGGRLIPLWDSLLSFPLLVLFGAALHAGVFTLSSNYSSFLRALGRVLITHTAHASVLPSLRSLSGFAWLIVSLLSISLFRFLLLKRFHVCREYATHCRGKLLPGHPSPLFFFLHFSSLLPRASLAMGFAPLYFNSHFT